MRLCLCGLRLCLRVRRGWTMSGGPEHRSRPDLPALAQSQALAQWLAGPRSRALRRASIGLRRRVLEAGCGHGVVTAELQRRARGTVTCLDRNAAALRRTPGDVSRVAGDCCHVPFPAASFDLVFFQNTLLWVSPLDAAVQETVRVLDPGGVLVAIEPDYGGMMEYPDMGLQALWLAGLSRAGADPIVGRKLAGLCQAASLDVWVELVHLPQPALPEAVELLYDLPLTADEHKTAQAVAHELGRKQETWSVFIHVPYFLIVATKP